MIVKQRSYTRVALLALIVAVFVLAIVLFRNVSWTLGWPPFVFLIAMMALGAGIGVIIHYGLLRLSNWFAGLMQMGEHNEIAGHFLGVMGVIYAVVLAFVVVTAWQQYDHTDEVVLQEQREVNTLFHLMGAYRESNQAVDIQWLLRDYAANTVREWQQMQRAEHPLCPDFIFRTSSANEADLCASSNPRVDPVFLIAAKPYPLRSTNCLAREIMGRVSALQPAGTHDDIIYLQSMGQAESFVQDRTDRLRPYDEPPLPGVLWLSFPLGALILICMTYFIANQDSRSQLLRTSALCAMIGMMTALALIFDHPFTGHAQISKSGWNNLIANFQHEIEHGGMSERASETTKTVTKSLRVGAGSSAGTPPEEPPELENICAPIPPGAF
jgi:hypothetical protein